LRAARLVLLLDEAERRESDLSQAHRPVALLVLALPECRVQLLQVALAPRRE
jgi:hypothetical protein